MEWLLILSLMTPDGQVLTASVGLMATQDACNLAGVGMTTLMVMSGEATKAEWRCVFDGVEA